MADRAVRKAAGTGGQAKTLTAWVITKPMRAIELSGGTPIAVFAHGTIDIVSVGLNAEALVSPRYSNRRTAGARRQPPGTGRPARRRRPAHVVQADRVPGARGSEPDMSDTAEFARMRTVMRASEKHREGGVDPELEDADADPGSDA